jgi:hypothetical protein
MDIDPYVPSYIQNSFQMVIILLIFEDEYS